MTGDVISALFREFFEGEGYSSPAPSQHPSFCVSWTESRCFPAHKKNHFCWLVIEGRLKRGPAAGLGQEARFAPGNPDCGFLPSDAMEPLFFRENAEPVECPAQPLPPAPFVPR